MPRGSVRETCEKHTGPRDLFSYMRYTGRWDVRDGLEIGSERHNYVRSYRYAWFALVSGAAFGRTAPACPGGDRPS